MKDKILKYVIIVLLVVLIVISIGIMSNKKKVNMPNKIVCLVWDGVIDQGLGDKIRGAITVYRL
jgi:hypothetical protein